VLAAVLAPAEVVVEPRLCRTSDVGHFRDFAPKFDLRLKRVRVAALASADLVLDLFGRKIQPEKNVLDCEEFHSDMFLPIYLL
jgi:hypothetical protein